MKPIEKDELYEHLTGYLKNKGIELKEGAYSKGIHAGCSLLADAINLSQRGLERAKGEIDKNLDRVRQVIHEKTAPSSQRQPSKSDSSPAGARSQKGGAGNATPIARKRHSKVSGANRKPKVARGASNIRRGQSKSRPRKRRG